MDIREIIKWLIHGLLQTSRNTLGYGFRNDRMFLFFLILFIQRAGAATNPSDVSPQVLADGWTNNIDSSTLDKRDFGESDNVLIECLGDVFEARARAENDTRLSKVAESGRTFGRPFKKMLSALLPLVFQLGAASTWMLVAALLSFKGLLVGLAILKLLLVAAAAKVGALFASKVDHQHHPQPHWEPAPHKEVHLHIHNSPQPVHHEEYGGWSRDGSGQLADGVQLPGGGPLQLPDPAPSAGPLHPYSGPDVINTPFGSYLKIAPAHAHAHAHNS